MVMLTDSGGDRNDDDSKSPWKKPPNNVDSPLMGAAASWPALSDARDAPPPSIPVKQPASSDTKGSNAHPSSHGSRYRNRHQKTSFKPNNPTHPAPPLNEPAPPPPPLTYPIMPPIPIQHPSYPYPPAPFPFPPAAGGKTKIQPFVPTAPPIDAIIHAPPMRAPFAQDPAFSPHTWDHQRPFYPGIRPQGFVRPYFAPPAGFMVGSRIPGAPPMYFLPAPLLGPVMVSHPPHFMQHPTTPTLPEQTPKATDLKTRILKQIEYYFR